MLTKFLIFIAVIFGVFVVARMGAASALGPKRRRGKQDSKLKDAEDLIPCPTCGAWVARGQPCSCGENPTP